MRYGNNDQNEIRNPKMEILDHELCGHGSQPDIAGGKLPQ